MNKEKQYLKFVGSNYSVSIDEYTQTHLPKTRHKKHQNSYCNNYYFYDQSAMRVQTHSELRLNIFLRKSNKSVQKQLEATEVSGSDLQKITNFLPLVEIKPQISTPQQHYYPEEKLNKLPLSPNFFSSKHKVPLSIRKINPRHTKLDTLTTVSDKMDSLPSINEELQSSKVLRQNLSDTGLQKLTQKQSQQKLNKLLRRQTNQVKELDAKLQLLQYEDLDQYQVDPDEEDLFADYVNGREKY